MHDEVHSGFRPAQRRRVADERVAEQPRAPEVTARELPGQGWEIPIALTPEQAAIILNGSPEDLISMRSAMKQNSWPSWSGNVYIPYVISGEYNEDEQDQLLDQLLANEVEEEYESYDSAMGDEELTEHL